MTEGTRRVDRRSFALLRMAVFSEGSEGWFMKMDHRRWVLVFAALSVLVAAFIWGNSLRTVEQADRMKSSLSQVVKPIVDPKEQVEKNTFLTALSKTAHIVEFGVLGLCVAGLAVSLGRLKERTYVALPLLLVLVVGVIDEFLQTFSGRTSAVTDVLIDFGGALIGLSLGALGWWLVGKLKKKTSGA